MLNKKNIPTYFTYARIVAIPLFIYVYVNGFVAASLAIFVLASTTDFLDGYFARKWKVESLFGAMLDQIADKLLVCAVLLCLLSAGQAALIPVIIIVFREILVSGLREFMGNIGLKMPVSKLGKWKTATQLLAIIALIFAPIAEHEYVHNFGEVMLWAAALISAITGYQYMMVVLRKI
jgi:CDP-diacylglycerol--glycerol-3-phosphate 3-phosphatidyltransferase